jgi:hypothetical protein
MNIAKLNALIPASFEYTDAITGETEQITLQLKRMSFGAASSKSFREAMDNEDTGAMAEMLSNLIGEWNIDANGEVFEPTAENISALPADFVGKLSECVFARLFPNPQNANTSPNGSEPAEKSLAESTAD